MFLFFQLDRGRKGPLNRSHAVVQCFSSMRATSASFLCAAKPGDQERRRRATAVVHILVAQVFQSGWGGGASPAGSPHQALLQHWIEALAAF